MLKRKFSQGQGALGKGFDADTKMGPRPVAQTMLVVRAADADDILASTALTADVQVVASGITDPSTYRALSITGNQSSVDGTVTILGHDWAGRTISEDIVASGTATIVGLFPFKDVVKVTLPVLVSSGDEISVGYSDKLGLYRPITLTADVLELERRPTASGEYTVEGTDPAIDVTYGTFLPDGGITAADSFKIAYLSLYL